MTIKKLSGAAKIILKRSCFDKLSMSAILTQAAPKGKLPFLPSREC